MTSLSSSSLDNSVLPFSRVQNTLQRDVSAGVISATDQTALTSALGDIASQLSASASTAGTAADSASSATTTPTSMKERVDSLIDNEVSSGKLTGDQAAELKTAFNQAHAHMHGAHGHHGSGGGLLTAPTKSSTSDGASSTDVAATGSGSTTSIGTAASTAIGALETFISQFKSAVSSNGLYGSTGTSSSSVSSLLVNSIG